MKATTNLDVIISVRNYLLSKLTKDSDVKKVYSIKHPSKNLPDKFYLVKSLTQKDYGSIDQRGVIEICAYAKNLNQVDDQTQPDLSSLKSMVNAIYPFLDDAIIDNIAILSINSTTVSDSAIGYHYESLICETLSIKQIK